MRRSLQRTNSAPKVAVPFVVSGGRRLVKELHINYNMREVLAVLAEELNHHPDDVSTEPGCVVDTGVGTASLTPCVIFWFYKFSPSFLK